MNSDVLKDSGFKNQFRWRYKSLGNEWTEWKITQEYDNDPRYIDLDTVPQSGLLHFGLITNLDDSYYAFMKWEDRISKGQLKNAYSTSQALMYTAGNKKDVFLLEVQRIFKNPSIIVENKFKWRYKSSKSDWSKWMTTPAYGLGEQTIYLDIMTQSGLLYFNIEILSDGRYAAEIFWTVVNQASP